MPISKNLATEKQFEYAKKIAETLEIPMPQEFTKQAYFDFIQHYESRYKVACQRMSDDDYGLEEDYDY